MSLRSLVNEDKKWWGPAEQIVQWLCDRLPAKAKVLEIGPGYVPFPRADTFVDYKDLPGLPAGKVKVSVDLASEPLPFPDKTFDFVYCRHVLEDMYNPFLLIREMERVGSAGYIEMPSPIAELCRGIDGSSPPFRGYHHHRFIGWVHEGEFRLISKYPFVEYINWNEEDIVASLRAGPRFWNTYFLWQEKINFVHRQNGPDYLLTRDYAMILKGAMDSSKISSGTFWQNLPGRGEIDQSALPKFAA